MENYDKLADRLVKGKFSLSELQDLVSNDLVASVIPQKADEKHLDCKKFVVKLKNDDIYYIYVKNK